MRRHLFWPLSRVYISVIITHILYNTNHAGPSVWAAIVILELYIRIQIRIIQLLIFTEKFSPLPGFEPGTLPVSSLYVTNWAILSWMTCQSLVLCHAVLATTQVKLVYWLLKYSGKYKTKETPINILSLLSSITQEPWTYLIGYLIFRNFAGHLI